MITFKCKMCGGDLELTQGSNICECPFCGTTQTLPQAEDDQRANRYNRANHFRRQNEFDKAISAYERILESDDTDAEAHWGVVLSRFGIEYVEDPVSHKRIPTCHRVQVASILTDEDYLAALEYAPDAASRELYEQQAAEIAEIQKGILAISRNEKPYDVFICYKETDAEGKRTRDSALAQEVYYGLTEQGYKVFFSRITLEDKLGQQYEPFIFAALNSAKVMLVIGTKPEHFNAVWVKNEWSRYLSLMQNDRSRLLIPCYRDMDPYDLPEELSNLQSQDMGKIGFMQDLLRGVKKVLDAEKASPAVQPVTEKTAVSAGSTNINNLYKRARLFLEDGDFRSAAEYADRILDEDAEYAPAYLVKVLAAHQCRNEQELEDRRADRDLLHDPDMTKAIRFAQDGEAYRLMAKHAVDNAVFAEIMQTLSIALDAKAGTEADAAAAEAELQSRVDAEGSDDAEAEAYKNAVGSLQEMESYPHAGVCAQLCKILAEIMPLFKTYQSLIRQVQLSKQYWDWKKCKELAHEFEKLGEFRDSKEQATSQNKKAKEIVHSKYSSALENLGKSTQLSKAAQYITEIREMESEIDISGAEKLYEKKSEEIAAAEKAEEERREEQRRKAEADRIAAKAAEKRNSIIGTVIVLMILAAIAAYFYFIKPMMKYNDAKALYDTGRYEEAIEAFTALNGYGDSVSQIASCRIAIKERAYNEAKALLQQGKYAEAYEAFVALKDYKDVDNLLKTDKHLIRGPYTKVGNTVTYGHYEQDNNTGNGKEAIEWIILEYDDTNEQSLLISRYGLFAYQYHKNTPCPTWEESDIRAWLNSNFLNAAFSAEEQKGIVTKTVSTIYGSRNTTTWTWDRIWLLSQEEATKYFLEDSDRKAIPTKYAAGNGVAQYSSSEINRKLSGTGCCWWWLRSPGDHNDNALCVGSAGSVESWNVSSKSAAVRPAFWLNLETAEINY